ncbi:hypothetical protein SAMN04487857_102271 [Pseudomonas sp. ok272]|uniref:hypothetical protein n=1 Tax=unclassified Pseudomonas TaxID=196821 RepID=UPI0008ADA2AA|nr:MULTISPECIES: hypothetical protein [unclassified Pseudomonas]SEM49296.1 hypothetical protein SAMN04487857_102271 [Pseudomonas sp. ok272]SFM20794.1 hypothetical protein SAMN04487858_101272 [Pseudomonas sp. ok602]
MEYLIIWIAVAVLSGYYANQKGRNVVSWVVLGFFLSVFALIALWFLPPLGIADKRSDIARKLDMSGRYRKCPSCAELVENEAIKCKHCHVDLPALAE